ncbi:MAG: 2-amino-4-hydroxy-6-hydroxymethyldihydropteridine diphosphokinase [Hydrogenovibrio sp.]|uniref:2-amino-4-hydroxy-6- hydroxymethyldihydropteridine diphosphokinase n=1 Tax=Hydrogenovibrio sp. TaxID=2065821 RepID=UPI002870273D|nr:2-amino-4-hydroxy-6-hydroxymethyldihydropteridine diphosphokinase [Hydrogenovibrio sp.]MDR9497865.1 2-amino-4-hydroxy-6-hydroxymethyldihydropteridine diphosphokinase [Hydrogenovibrio sp.]
MSRTDEHTVFVGLGSNLHQPAHQVRQALTALGQLEQTRLNASSQLYASRPQGPQDQPDFVNAVACLSTRLSPEALLSALQNLERQQGKVKNRHWGERVIDLDLLLYSDWLIDTKALTVPHPQIQQRDFVLVPLLELAPELRCPRTGEPYQQALAKLPEHFLTPS